MNKKDVAFYTIIALLIVIALYCCSGRESEEEYTSPEVNYKSSYWYDSPKERKRKADETLDKYYTRDENGNLKRRAGTIVNGKPWKEK